MTDNPDSLVSEREPRRIARGDRFVAYPSVPRSRLYIDVIRVARDGAWADIRVRNCFVMWTKRQKLDGRGLPPASVPYDWTTADLEDQARNWEINHD